MRLQNREGSQKMSPEEEDIVRRIVKAVLFLDHTKKPFKRSDIMSCVGRKTPGRLLFQKLFDEAKERLIQLGFELVEMRDKTFFLISRHQSLPFMHVYDSEEEVANRTLLTLILSYIFMKNGKVTSGELLDHLSSLNIYSEGDKHPYFGNVKDKLFNLFADQLYLSISRIPEIDLFDVRWGLRAEKEVNKNSLLKFICVCGFDGKLKPQDLAAQHESALSEAEQSPAPNSNAEIYID